jgi:2,4-dienoyl-CoA reductase-like NADH-dependent reductase (Old Yellow Enzyme family)
MTSLLFTPLQLGPMTAPNRIAVAPMCQYSAIDGVPQPWHRQHLGALAVSGAGVVVAEATGVVPEARITHGCTGLWNDTQERVWGDLVRDMKAVGAGLMGIQLAHAGRKASSQRPWEGGAPIPAGAAEKPWQTVSATATPHAEGWHTPEQLDAGGIKALADAFAASARRAARAGFDLVELHAAHGYLLHQFTSPLSNTRTDAYGGTLEKRMRAPLEIAAALRGAWPRDRVLGARISGSDWAEGGATPDDAVVFARELKAIGYDWVCVSSGALAQSKIKVGPGYQVPFAAQVKREAGIVTRAVGMIVTPQQAEAILRAGDADQIALARAFIDDPRWPWRAAEALGDPAPVPPQCLRARPATWPGAALYKQETAKA